MLNGAEGCCGGEFISLRPDREDKDDSAYAAVNSSGVIQGFQSMSSSESKALADSYRSFAAKLHVSAGAISALRCRLPCTTEVPEAECCCCIFQPKDLSIVILRALELMYCSLVIARLTSATMMREERERGGRLPKWASSSYRLRQPSSFLPHKEMRIIYATAALPHNFIQYSFAGRKGSHRMLIYKCADKSCAVVGVGVDNLLTICSVW